MGSYRKTSVIVGLIFVVATVSALLGAAADGILSGPDFLSGVAANRAKVLFCVIMYLVAAFTSAGISVALYPVLRVENSALAIGAVVFRAIEAVFYMVAVLSLLSVVAVGQKIVSAASDQQTAMRVAGGILLKLREHASLLGVVSFCVGSLLYYWIFLQSRLVPLWLSVWGIIAVVLMLVACALSLFDDSPITGYTFLILPIALQEMVLALWLIIRGFRGQEKGYKTT